MDDLPGLVVRKTPTGRGWEIAHEASGAVIGIPFKGRARAVAAMHPLCEFDWTRPIDEIRKDDRAMRAGALVMFTELVAKYPGEACYAERLAQLTTD